MLMNSNIEENKKHSLSNCYKCKSIKEIDKFYQRQDGSIFSACIECQKFIQIDRKLKNEFNIDENIIIKDFFDHSFFWSVPKISSSNLYLLWQRLNTFIKFNGRKWVDNQIDYLKELNKNDLYNPTSAGGKNFADGAPARLHKRLFELMGFVREYDDGHIIITDVGFKYIQSNNLLELKNEQNKKFQYNNPVFNYINEDISININPHIFLLNILCEVDKNYITKEEFVLFVSRATTFAETNYVLKKIEFWRNYKNKDKLIDNIKNHITTTRNNSLFNKIYDNSSYSVQFFGHCNYLSLEDIESTPEIEFISIPLEKLQNAKDIRENLLKVKLNSYLYQEEWFNFYTKEINFEEVETSIPNEKTDKNYYDLNPFLFQKIDGLFTVRVTNQLQNLNFKFLGDIVSKNKEFFIKTDSLGVKSADEIELVIQKKNLKFEDFSFVDLKEELDFDKIYNHYKSLLLPLQKEEYESISSNKKYIIDELEIIFNLTNLTKNKEIILYHFGLVDNETNTLQKTGDKFTLTRERVRQIISEFQRKTETQFSKFKKEFLFSLLINANNEIGSKTPHIVNNIFYDRYQCSIYTINELLKLFNIDQKFTIKNINNNIYVDSKDRPLLSNINNIISECKKYIDSNGLSNVSILAEKYELPKDKLKIIIKSFPDFEFLNDNNWFYKKNKLHRNRLYNTVEKLFTFSHKFKIIDFLSAVMRQQRIEILPPKEIILEFTKKFFNPIIEEDNIFINNKLQNNLNDSEKILIKCFSDKKILHRNDFLIIANELGLNTNSANIYLGKSILIKRVAEGYYSLVNEELAKEDFNELNITNKRNKIIKDWGYTNDMHIWYGIALTKLNLIGENITVSTDLINILNNKEFKVMEDKGVDDKRIIKLSKNKIIGFSKDDFVNVVSGNQMILKFYLSNLFVDISFYKNDKITELRQ